MHISIAISMSKNLIHKYVMIKCHNNFSRFDGCPHLGFWLRVTRKRRRFLSKQSWTPVSKFLLQLQPPITQLYWDLFTFVTTIGAFKSNFIHLEFKDKKLDGWSYLRFLEWLNHRQGRLDSMYDKLYKSNFLLWVTTLRSTSSLMSISLNSELYQPKKYHPQKQIFYPQKIYMSTPWKPEGEDLQWRATWDI